MEKLLDSGYTQTYAALFAALFAGVLFWIYERRKEKLERAKAFRDLFAEFNKRFDNLNGVLNDIWFASKHNLALPNKYENKVKDYLNLCAEEYLWTTKEYENLIQPRIWNAWYKGILYYLEAPAIKKIFCDELLEGNAADSYYGLAEKLAKDLK